MTMTLRTEVLDMPFKDPFRIARAEDTESATTVLTELELDSQEGTRKSGIGEAFPVPYYGETLETVQVLLPRLLEALEPLGPMPSHRRLSPSLLK